MSDTNLQLRSTITENNQLQLALVEGKIPQPAENEVVVRIEAAPINPSDLAVLLGPADISTIRQVGSSDQPVLAADVPENLMASVAARVGKAIPLGNEGAGTVVAAGTSDQAQALMGKTVGVFGGAAFQQYAKFNVAQCLELAPGTSAVEGASSTVNPMTALAMTETMVMEGHSALIHTAAASNLGQMLNRICLADGIDLVNIVRKPEQETLLKELGAKYVVDSSSPSFRADLTQAIAETGATLTFDATGGGRLASDVMGCMEAAASRNMTQHSVYGSDVHKQLYIYGFLDQNLTALNTRSFGFTWGMGGFLLTPFLQKAGRERVVAMRTRIANEINTTFASHYCDEITLHGALQLDTLSRYAKQSTGEKFLVRPNEGIN